MQRSALRKVLLVCGALVVAGGFANDAFARGGGHDGGGHDGGGHSGASMGSGGHFGGSNGGRLGGHFGDGQRDHQRSGSQPAVAGSPALISPFVVTRPDDPASDCRLNDRVLIGGQWVWESTQIC